MSMSQHTARMYGAYLPGTYREQLERLMAIGVAMEDPADPTEPLCLTDVSALPDARDEVASFYRGDPSNPLEVFPHLYLVDGQPWDEAPLYFIGWPMDARTLEQEEALHPGITRHVNEELVRLNQVTGWVLAPLVEDVTHWC